jgi:hypothetical protein
MRLRKRDLAGRVNSDLPIEFVPQKLTSYGGLAVLSRFLRAWDLNRRVRRVFADLRFGGDYSVVSMVRLVLILLWVGGRRLGHVAYVREDPLVGRVAQLRVLPHERTLSRWLKQFTRRGVEALGRLNAEVVGTTLRALGVRRVTLDVDGSVVSTGLQVGWAFRGYNPHRRKVPSYYPILAHVAQTGQVIAVKNRPGNVHDGRRSESFLRAAVEEVRRQLGRWVKVEIRLDAAFFQRSVIEALSRLGVEWGLKVPMMPWLGLKRVIQERRRWQRMNGEISYFEARLPVEGWGLNLRVVVYRKRVHHPTRKNYQLDLFSPDDGHFEYQTVATNKAIGAQALWFYMAGRGAQEKTLAELKDGLAFDSVPTNHYGANSAWQQLSVLALNLLRRFQFEAGSAARARSRKRTYLYVFESIKTVRFQWLNVAGRLVKGAEGLRLRLADVPAIRKRYQRLEQNLAKAA